MAFKNYKETFKEEFEQRIIDLARITRVVAGGKRLRFRVCLAIGDKKGRFGIGVGKAVDVTSAVTKALAKAKKNLISVPLINETIPHQVEAKFKAAKLLLKPAKKGTGIKTGGPVRIVCELAGIANITGKILGTQNKINNVKALILAFKKFKLVKKSGKAEKEVEEKEPVQTEVKNDNKQEDSKNIEAKKTLKDKFKNLIKRKE